jgi:hypothetical protein
LCGETAGIQTPHLQSIFLDCGLHLCYISSPFSPPSPSQIDVAVNEQGTVGGESVDIVDRTSDSTISNVLYSVGS